MCPFDDPLDLNSQRAQIVALWHEEQRLRKEHAKLLEQKARQAAQILRLKQELAAARATKKKHKSERRGRTGHNNPEKGPGADVPEPAEAKSDNEPQEGHGPREQPHLELQPKLFDLDEADKVCTQCGSALEEWEEQFQESILIEVIERRFVCQLAQQKKYRCRCGACIETAPGPEKLIPGGRYALSFAIEVAYDKYMLHSPLERQAREMTRQGLVIDSQTLWDQTYALACVLRPAYEAIHRYVLSHGWVAADETTWWMMRHKHTPAEQTVGQWYIWIAHRPDAAFYILRPTRDEKPALELLSLPTLDAKGQPVLDAEGAAVRTPYRGKVLCDGWWAYKYLAAREPDFVLVHCWSHVRREALGCAKGYPQQTNAWLDLIGELYAIESRVPAGPENDARRLELRRTESVVVLEKLEAWVYQNALQVPAQSALRTAIGYMVNPWTGLVRFLDDPTLPLDNNGVEKDCRQPVLGKRNHYGSRSERGVMVAEILYTVVQTSKLSCLEPKTYTRFAALRQMRGKSVVLPHEVTAEHLREELGLSEDEAERALARRRREPVTPAG